VHRRGELDSCVVHQDVHPPELTRCLRHHVGDGLWLAHVGRAVGDGDAELRGERCLQVLDLDRIAESVEQDVRVLGGQCARNA
jgi:hypothetical protein